MAGGKDFEEFVPLEEEAGYSEQRARRQDLSGSFGVVVAMPAHGQDEHGNWRYGLTPIGGVPNWDLADEFEAEMRSLIKARADELVSRGLLDQDTADSIVGHRYSTGPAAQEWVQYFFELREHAQPLINDGASLLAWGYFFKDILWSMKNWPLSRTRWSEDSLNEDEIPAHRIAPVEVTPVLTDVSLISLCYLDLSERYGIGGEISVDVYPRAHSEYETPDHPGAGVTYLLRFRSGKRQFFYLVDSTAVVLEHYLVTGKDITLLSLPQFVEDDFGASLRQPKVASRSKINRD